MRLQANELIEISNPPFDNRGTISPTRTRRLFCAKDQMILCSLARLWIWRYGWREQIDAPTVNCILQEVLRLSRQTKQQACCRGGAGPGGLATAMQLAHAGVKVTVLEKQNWVGGRTATFEQDGFHFDIGPTFFLYPRVLSEIFASVGRDLMQEVPMKRLDPQYRISFGAGGKLDATPTWKRWKNRSLFSLHPIADRSLATFVTTARNLIGSAACLNLRSIVRSTCYRQTCSARSQSSTMANR